MKPSRTYTLGVFGVLAQLLLAGAALLVMAFAPDHLPTIANLLGELGMYAAACAGAGAGALAARDYGSGGLTSSQGEAVLANTATKAKAKAPPTPGPGGP